MTQADVGGGWRPVGFRFAVVGSPVLEAPLARWAGASRFVYNALLAQVKAGLDARAEERAATGRASTQVPWSKYSLIKAAYQLRRELSWSDDVPAAVFECAAANLAAGLENWGASRSGKRKGRRVGFPVFKAKKHTTPRFRLRHPEQLRVEGRAVRVSCLGWVRVHDDTRRLRRMLANGRFQALSTTLSFRRGRWWLAINGRAAPLHPEHRHQGRVPGPVGVDLGVRRLMTVADSDGRLLETVEGVKALQGAHRRLRRAQRAWARTKPGSKGRRQATERLTRQHAQVAHRRQHQLHTVTSGLVARYQSIVIENLNVAGMHKNHRLAGRLGDQAFGEFRRQLAYKSDWYGGRIVIADRWYPSSKTCSACGHAHRELGSAPRFVCPACGLMLDRDHNAAINLARLALPHAESPPLVRTHADE